MWAGGSAKRPQVAKQSTTLSPRDLARAIDVSESSVKRWADDGQLEVIRTSGGHRRIRLDEAIRFVREAGHDVVRPDLLGVSTPTRVSERVRGPTTGSLLEALLASDGRAARHMIVLAYVQGSSVAGLCDGVIREALEDIGQRWHEEGPKAIALEHYAVDTCVQALMEIRGLMQTPGRAPLAVGGAGPGDPYVLPSLMASIALMDAGFRVLNLGADVPTQAVVASVQAHAPAFVWRSYSLEMPAPSLATDLRSISRALPAKAGIAFGGRGVPRSRQTPENASYFGSMTELTGFARGRHRPPRKRSPGKGA